MATDLSGENYALNNEELDRRKTVLSSKPVRLSVVLTTKCNLNCIMCTRERDGKELEKRSLNKIKGLLPYIKTLGWQGGEVFYHKDFKDVFNDISGNFTNVRQEIITNGLLIDKNWAEAIARANVSLAVSIDSAEKDVYEHIRKGAAFGDLISSLEELMSAEKKYNRGALRHMNVVVMRSNHKSLPDLLRFAHKYSFKGLHVTPVYGQRGGENIFTDTDKKAVTYLAKEMAALKEQAAAYGISLSDQVSATCGRLLGDNAAERGGQKAAGDSPEPEGWPDNGLFCAHPWRELVIHAAKDGGIFPDCACLVPVGNINSDELLDAWNGEKMQQYRKRMSGREVNGWCNKDCVDGMINPLSNYNY